MSQKLQNASLRVRQEVIKIKHWPTDTLSIDYHLNVKMVPENEDHDGSIQENCSRVEPHTIIVFIPGNPGCIGWYVPFLESIVKQLGVGYAVRGISYAGHGVGEDIVGPDDLHRTSQGDLLSQEKKRISWTIDGQVEHKLEWVDQWTKSVRPKSNLILIGHSIGCHILQRMCILRKDILSRTIDTIYLMPFIIFDPPLYSQKVFLNTGARTEILAKLILDTSTRIAKRIPQTFLDSLLEKLAGVHDKEGRILALNLITSPAMARNFLSLGMEELRDVPQIPDVSSIFNHYFCQPQVNFGFTLYLILFYFSSIQYKDIRHSVDRIPMSGFNAILRD